MYLRFARVSFLGTVIAAKLLIYGDDGASPS